MSKSKDFATPIAIVVAGAIVALALYFALSGKAGAPTANNNPADNQAAQEVKIRPIQEDDLVKGNKDAKVIVFEYSDTECPFCKRFHETMNQVVKDYGDQVAWVYRHLPLDQLHPKARTEAMAVECAVKLAGPDKGFAYLDRIMEITPSNNGLDLAELPKIADYVGLNKAAFQKCLDNKETADKVKEDSDEAIYKAGARGTPHNVIMIKGEKQPLVVPGGFPYEKMKELLDQVLAK